MDDYSLLKIIYKHLKIEELLQSEPGLSRQDIDAYFLRIRDALGIRPPKNKSKIEELHLYTDGASRGNPGPAAVGCILKDKQGAILLETGKYIGKATSNVAEYRALLLGLDLALPYNPESLVIFSDSELLIKQMTGVYKTRKYTLRKLREQVDVKLEKFRNYSFKTIPRDLNTGADALANKSLDERDS